MKEENLQLPKGIWRCLSYINTSEFLKVSSVQRVLRNSTLNCAYVNLDGQVALPAALSSNEPNLSKHCDVCQDVTSNPTFPSSSSSLTYTSSVCWNSLSRLSHDPLRVPATIRSTVYKWKTEGWKVRDLPLAMHASFSLTPLLSCCSVAGLPMMAPARHIYWKADNQLKWPACPEVSDLQWDSKGEKNVNQLRIFMFDTRCYDN